MPTHELPAAYVAENHRILTAMRKTWTAAADRVGLAAAHSLRIRAGVRAIAAVVTYGVAMQRQTEWPDSRLMLYCSDGMPYDPIRRPWFKACRVVVDRRLPPETCVVDHAAS